MTTVIELSSWVDKNTLINLHRKISSVLIADKNDEFGFKYGFYIVRTWNFLKKYAINSLDSFFEEKQNIPSTKEIFRYIQVAREYTDVSILQNQYLSCPYCSSSSMEKTNNFQTICDNCGVILENKVFGIRDVKGNLSKSVYSLNANLINAIKRYEGCSNIPDIVYERLDSELKKRRIPYSIITKNTIFTMLKSLDMKKYYEDINTIYRRYTNKPIESVEHLIPEILHKHSQFESVYPLVKDKDRVNSLNVNIKLFVCLKQLNVDCTLNDFCFLKTESKRHEYEDQISKTCKLLNWRNPFE